jgi:hypothetical protein
MRFPEPGEWVITVEGNFMTEEHTFYIEQIFRFTITENTAYYGWPGEQSYLDQ